MTTNPQEGTMRTATIRANVRGLRPVDDHEREMVREEQDQLRPAVGTFGPLLIMVVVTIGWLVLR